MPAPQGMLRHSIDTSLFGHRNQIILQSLWLQKDSTRETITPKSIQMFLRSRLLKEITKVLFVTANANWKAVMHM